MASQIGFNQQTVLEGVGDEVLLGVLTTFILIALVSIVYNSPRGPRYIHPLQEEQVQITRDRLGFGPGVADEQPDADRGADRGPVLPTAPPAYNPNDRQCPVCLNEARFLTTTNCGHVFCGKYIHHDVMWFRLLPVVLQVTYTSDHCHS